jgi:hypothetical protein
MSFLIWIAGLVVLLAAFVRLLPRPEPRTAAPPGRAGLSQGEKEKITPAGAAAMFCSFWAAVYVAYQAGAYLFLVFLYGLWRVCAEGLYFVAMPKGGPWVVSNGDLITEGHYLQFLFALPLMAVLHLVFFAVAARLSAWPLFRAGQRPCG